MSVHGYNLRNSDKFLRKEDTQKVPVPQLLLVPSKDILEDFFSVPGLLFYVFWT